jgi:hypothetical protein
MKPRILHGSGEISGGHYEDGKGLARRHTRQAPARVIVKHRVSE